VVVEKRRMRKKRRMRRRRRRQKGGREGGAGGEKEEEKEEEENEEEEDSGKMQTYRQYQTILQFAQWQVIRRTQASRSWPPVALYRRIMFIALQHANAHRAPYCYGKSDRLLDRHTLVLYRNKCIVKLCTHLIGA